MRELKELKLKDKEYIIFDMDGTLIDSIGVWNRTDQKMIHEYGGLIIELDEIQKERDAFLHRNQASDIYLAYCEYLIRKYDLSIKDASELCKIRGDKSGEILETEIDFKPNVASLILRLKELGFTLVLATMTTQIQLDIYSKKNKWMLEQMNIMDVFDLIIRKEDVKNKKPHPEIYDKVIQYYNTTPDKCLVFEDSYTGVLASHNAKIDVVNIYDKYADLDRDKINEITDYSINDYNEFIDLVNSVYPRSKGEPLRKKKIIVVKQS